MSYKYQQCPSCFELSTAERLVCPFCSADMQRVNYHPWRRFMARWIDLMVILLCWTLLAVVLLAILLPLYGESVVLQKAGQFFSHSLIAYPLMVVLYIFGEAILLSTFGNTPGKKLYRIRLSAGGVKPAFRVALKRTLMVWSVGMGMLIPVLSLYAFYMARKRLTKTGITLWDAEGGFQVSHRPWGIVYSVWVVLVSAMVYLVLLGISMGST